LLGLAQLARMIAETETTPSVLGDRIDIAELADRYVTYAERRGRKRSTIANVKSEVRCHLVPFFGTKAVDSKRWRQGESRSGTGGLPEGRGRLAGERWPVPRQAA
jgi:hypothetical protein